MTGVPRFALWLGLAGLLPFLWGAACAHSPQLADISLQVLGPAPRLMGVGLVVGYGLVILSFMSGVLWGFATRADRRAGLYFTLSVLPALWGFFLAGGDAPERFVWLGAGYLGLLALDWIFARAGLAPTWWMRLRLLLTAAVLVCLAVAALA